MSKIITELNCRVCLQVEELMVHIYEEVEDFQSDLSSLLEQCGGLKVDQNDCYPKYLCKECTSELLIAAKFREKCERTQQILQQIELEQPVDTNASEALSLENENNENIEEQQIVPLPPYEEENLKLKNSDEYNMELLVYEVPQKLESDTAANVRHENAPDSDDANDLIVFGTDDAVVDDACVQREQQVLFYVEGDDKDDSDHTQSHTEWEDNHNMLSTIELEDEQLLEEEQLELTTSTTSPPPLSSIVHQFVCDICGALFVQAFNLKRHMDRLHVPVQYYTCRKCQHCFSQQTLYAQHCNSCNFHSAMTSKSTKVTSNRAKPSSAHFKKRPSLGSSNVSTLDCSYCGKPFKNAFAYEMHLRTHTGERPFICGNCPKSFKTQGHLNTHLKRHAGQPDFICTVCNKTFYESSNLTAHMRTHTGERPHACSICSKRFSRVFLLQLHMRTHTGEKPYQCDSCDRSFAQTCDLKNHKQTHTGERRFQCPLCPKSFIKRHPMLQHLKKHSSLGLIVDDVAFSQAQLSPVETMVEASPLSCDSYSFEQLDLVEEVLN